MQPVGPDSQNDPFSRSNNPGAGKPPILPIFVCYNSPSFLVIWNSDVILVENFSCTSVKTLAMEPVVPDGQNGSFSRSNDPRTSPDGKKGPFSRSNDPRSSSQSFLVIQNFDVILAKKFKDVNPPFCRFSYVLNNGFLVIWNFDVILSKKNPWTSVKTIAMEPIGLDDQNDPFSRSNDPRSSPWIFGDSEFRRHFCRKFSWMSVETIAMEPVGPDGQNGPFSRSNEPRSSSLSFLVICNSDVIFAKNFIDVR
ncbi:hypothetical protein H5410_053014 [Solanum commersonii]|uniref:Uncharacterized protein n=1 Tax=Solanum commersonii TaxID=4109 RepID=A0A9J5X2N6_SOLCO|nr:hypothetical protein H5410_053014 [Solanum commersonii]